MSKKRIPIVNMERCDRCGLCVSACPENALRMTDNGPVFVQPITCTYCLACEPACPYGAIRAPLTVTWAPEA